MIVALTIGSAFVAVLFVGACTLQFTERALSLQTAPAFSRLVAWAVALVTVVSLPLIWERNRRRIWRGTDPLLRHPRTSWVLPWSLLLAVSLPVLAPDLARASLTTYGSWMVRGGPAVIERAASRVTAAVAQVIPQQTPLTLTHRTLWPWVDRASPECTGATAR
jgi:hypothetical protein